MPVVEQSLAPARAAAILLSGLFSSKPDDLFILIWIKRGDTKESHWFKSVSEAAAFATSITDADVYFGVGLSPENYGPKKRCLAKDIKGIAGVWIDIDIADGIHKKSNLPPDGSSAISLLNECPLEPTFILHSGGGLQAYWAFPELLTDQTRASALAERWTDYFKQLAAPYGWDVDATQDLARVMRVPGTFNHKRPPARPVQLLEAEGPSYNAADLEAFLDEQGIQGRSAAKPRLHLVENRPTGGPIPAPAGLVFNSLAKVNQSKFDALAEVNPKFLTTWNHKRRDMQDKSLSSYDFSLALISINAGWTDQEVLDLLVEHRRKWDKEKVDGRGQLRWYDYYVRTLNRAKQQAENNSSNAKLAEQQAQEEHQVEDGTAGPEAGGKKELSAGDNNDLAKITDEAWAVLEASNDPPRIFKYGNVPCRLEVNDLNKLRPVELDNKALRHEMAKVARWYKITKAGKADAYPPLDVMTNMLKTPDYPLPVLKQIVETPVFDAAGRLIETPGYDPISRFYYRPAPGLGDIPPIVGKPTPAEVDRAKAVIFDNLLCDFPFSTEADTAAAVSELLQPFCRDMLGRNTPLYLHEAPQAGTGKTLLAQILLYPALGHISLWSQPKDDDEMGKRIVAMLKSGSPVLGLDNCGYPIDSSTLAQVITTGSFSGRILGSSVSFETQVTATFVATANNPTMSAEIARRCVSIRLKSPVADPHKRTGFKHSSLREWIEANRADVCWAALTLIQNWIAAGRHLGTSILGGFETWARTMGGILNAAGIPGFLDNLTTLYDQADNETGTLRSFCALWLEKLPNAKVKASDLFEIAQQTHELDLGDGSPKSQITKLGSYLKKKKDIIVSIEIDVVDKETGEVLPDQKEYKKVEIKVIGSTNGSMIYRLEQIE